MIRKTDATTIQGYLTDASNFPGGCADEVVIPESVEELVEFLKGNTGPITIAGAGTGLTASRVPMEGRVISTERFSKLGKPDPSGVIQCGPAVRVRQLQDHLKSTEWFYPPNPTETMASIGGTLATNASGSRSYKWGATRQYVSEADVVLVDGRRTTVSRGQTIAEPLEFADGSYIEFPNIAYVSPDCKNAAGFFVQPDMDWLDLLIGSDGTLCLFLDIRLQLVPAPSRFLSGILFFESDEFCWQIVETLRGSNIKRIDPCALEYFDRFSLDKLRADGISIPEACEAALFFEQDIMEQNDFDACLEGWYELLEGKGVDLESSWFAETAKDIERFHDFRHRVPLLINEENSRSGRVKIGTDMAVADNRFQDLMRFYKSSLKDSGLPYVMFGHIGDNHLHINLLPEKSQMEQATALYGQLIDQVLLWGGTVSAEHGIGKLKKAYYHKMVGKAALEELKQIKALFDPKSLLGQGNLL